MRRHESAASIPVFRPLRRGQGWSVSEYICTAGPDDRPFEEQREQFAIAAVIEGTFSYRADAGTAVLHPGRLHARPGLATESVMKVRVTIEYDIPNADRIALRDREEQRWMRSETLSRHAFGSG